MRTRREIEKEYANIDFHIREVLLDIRDILLKPQLKRKYVRKKVGRDENVNTDKESG